MLVLEKNVETKLTSLGVPDHQQYISEIFGKQDGTVYEKGLLVAASDDEFDALLASLHEPWASREKSSSDESSSRFHLWMLQRADMMKSCIIARVKTGAGLGILPEKFYTNYPENTNRRLRHKTGGRGLGETAFAKAIKELIEDEQETEFTLAVFNGSEQYEFREPLTFNSFT